MLDRLFTDFADTQRAELMQYCKTEHVMPSTLDITTKPQNAVKLRLELTAMHFLQLVDKKLNTMINRLAADMEFSAMAKRRLS